MFEGVDSEIIEALGVSATYTATGGTSTTVSVIIEKGVQELDDGYLGERQNHALLADRTITPAAGDSLTVGSSVYAVSNLVEDDGFLMRILLA